MTSPHKSSSTAKQSYHSSLWDDEQPVSAAKQDESDLQPVPMFAENIELSGVNTKEVAPMAAQPAGPYAGLEEAIPGSIPVASEPATVPPEAKTTPALIAEQLPEAPTVQFSAEPEILSTEPVLHGQSDVIELPTANVPTAQPEAKARPAKMKPAQPVQPNVEPSGAPKIAFFDCFHGAAGDMLLAALLDAGMEQAELEAMLQRLPISGYRIVREQIQSHHVAVSRIRIELTDQQPSRSWRDIRAMLQESELPAQVRTQAFTVFERLAQTEAAIHGIAPEKVQFHEVGAVDSIIDVVGFCIGLYVLRIEQVYASPLPLGRGWIRTVHGLMPAPAFATLRLLADSLAPIVPAPNEGELVTPTAAALLTTLARFEQPAMRISKVGYGVGHTEFDRLNGLRIWLGEPL